MTTGSHGSTYGGNPLAMAVGQAVLAEITKPGFLKSVIEVADYMRAQLVGLANRHKHLVDCVRGMGLMLGVKLHQPPADVVAAARARGLLVATAGDNTIRLLPPLIITRQHVDEAIKILDETLAAIAPAEANT
jgi:acetylornithine/N-succinyldiaminopimelate aminotransferase